MRRQRLRFVLAGSGLLTTVIMLIWFSSWLRPPRSTDLVLLGADYAENLLVPHNSAGWHVLEDMARLPDAPQLQCWGTSLFKLVHPPLRLHTSTAWDRSLDTCSQETVLIYVAAHGGVDEQGAYLLPDDAQADGKASRLRLQTIIDRLAKLPADQHKILVLDCTVLVAEWSLGILVNDFARSLESLENQIIAVPNLVVIGASDKNERSWTCRSWQQTVFGHFLVEGIRGGVDDTDHDGRVDAWDLYAGVRDGTQRWAQANRAARQTPTILPRGKVGQRRARRIDLAPVARDHSPPPASPSVQFKLPREIAQAWETHQRLASQVPHPASYSPTAWRTYQDLLIRYEELLLAGNRSAAARVHRRMTQCRLDVERNLRCDLSSAQNSLAMFAATTGDRPTLPESASSCGVSPAPEKSLEILWNATLSERPKKWDQLCDPLQKDIAGQTRLRMALRNLILQRVKEDPPANLQTGASLLQLLDDPLHLRPTESHFLVMLARDLPTSPWDDRRRDLVQLAVDSRLLAERTAWCLRTTGYAYSERVVPQIASLVDRADHERRLGEDLLLSTPKDYVRSEEHFGEAQRQYQQAARQVTTIARAIEVHDTTIANIPYYARSIARRRPDLRDNRVKHQDWLAKFETICEETYQLGASLAVPPTADLPDNGRLTTITALTNTVVTGVKELEEAMEENWQMLVSADSPQAWCDLRDALRIPQPHASLRMKLLTSLVQTEQRLSDESTQRLARPIVVTAHQQSENRKWLARAEGRMALATLGRVHYESLVQPDEPTYDELQHRLEVFSVEQRWWRSAAAAGRAIGVAWRRIPQAIDGSSQAVDQPDHTPPDRTQGLCSLASAEQLSRILPSSLELNVYAEPADVARRARLQQLLEWQARRSFDNHWFAEDPNAEPYYLVAVQRYLDDAAMLFEKWTIDKQLRRQLTTRGGLIFDVTEQYDMTTEFQLNVPTHLAARDDLEVPAGFPVVWFEVGPSLMLSQSNARRSASQWSATGKAGPIACNINSPVLKQAEHVPPSTPTTIETELALHGRYRGQMISGHVGIHLHMAPTIVRAEFGAPAGASIAVRADRKIQQRYGAGNGSVAVVLDCTGSMGPPEGKPFNSYTKYAEATQALGRVLAELPPGTALSVWVFGQAVGTEKTVDAPEQTIRRILDPVRWDPNNVQQLHDLLSRIEYPALEPWNGSPIVRAILAAKHDLEAVRGFKTIVVVTDGIDNRVQADKTINPQGKDVPTLLRQAFRDSDIELNIIGFKIAAGEAATSREQFRIVESLTPPGVFCTVSESETLAEALDAALRQRMRYWLDTSDHHDVATKISKTNLSRGFEVSTTHANDQWHPGRLQPGNYWVDLNAAQPLEKAIVLSRGDQLLLRLKETPHGLNLQRAIYGLEDFPWKPFQISGSWRATVLQNQRVGTDSLQMLLGLEPNSGLGGSALTVTRPEQAWIELQPAQGVNNSSLVRWHTGWGYPIAAWNILVPRWPDSGKQQSAKPRIKMWWTLDATNTVDAVLRRPTDFHTLDDLTGKEVVVGGHSVQLDSVRVEEHWVQVAHDRRELRTCLVVRLRHSPAQTVWIRPEPLNTRGEEHRFYRQIGHYTGLFWPVTKDSITTAVDRLNLVSLETFRKTAEQRGNVIAFDKIPPPDPNAIGPRPMVTP